MFPRSLKIKLIQNWVQIISPCSQRLARCHVTRQRCSVALKLSAEQKSSFPLIAWGWRDISSQTGKELASWRVHRDHGFDHDGRREVLTTTAGILFLLARSGKLASSAVAPALWAKWRRIIIIITLWSEPYRPVGSRTRGAWPSAHYTSPPASKESATVCHDHRRLLRPTFD